MYVCMNVCVCMYVCMNVCMYVMCALLMQLYICMVQEFESELGLLRQQREVSRANVEVL